MPMPEDILENKSLVETCPCCVAVVVAVAALVVCAVTMYAVYSVGHGKGYRKGLAEGISTGALVCPKKRDSALERLGRERVQQWTRM